MSEPTRTPVISLGAGVQSTTLTLMAAAGELPYAPRLAIFADTGHEPAAVYEHLRWLTAEVAGRVEVVRVAELDLRDAATGEGFNPIPLYHAGGGVGRRQCTKQAKLYPIRHELRRRGYGPREPVVQLLGITVDEVERAKPSSVGWASNAWPLLELGLRRADCLAWMEARGYPRPPRSACVFCPFHSDREWREMREHDPASWDAAVTFDEAMRDRGEFVHRSLRPLADVDLSTPEDRGQLALMDECEGGCFL